MQWHKIVMCVTRDTFCGRTDMQLIKVKKNQESQDEIRRYWVYDFVPSRRGISQSVWGAKCIVVDPLLYSRCRQEE